MKGIGYQNFFIILANWKLFYKQSKRGATAPLFDAHCNDIMRFDLATLHSRLLRCFENGWFSY